MNRRRPNRFSGLALLKLVVILAIIAVVFIFVYYLGYEVKKIIVGFPPGVELEKKPAPSPIQKELPVKEKKSPKEGDTSIQIQQHTTGDKSPAGIAGRDFIYSEKNK